MSFDDIDQWAAYLLHLGSAPFTVLVIVVLGYVLRFVPAFPNKWIPITCVVLGMIIFPCLAHKHPDDTMRDYLIRTIFMGMIIGFGAFAFHDKILTLVEDKIPFLKDILAETSQSKETAQPLYQQ